MYLCTSSGPNPKASKKSGFSVLKTGKKQRVPLADVNGSNEDQENGGANAKKKSKTGRKERTQAVQEPTRTILDEATYDTTLTAA